MFMKFKRTFLRGIFCTKDEKKAENKNVDIPSLSHYSMFRYASVHDKLLIACAVVCAVISGCMLPIDSILFAKLCDAMVTYGSSDKDTEARDEFNEMVVLFTIGNCIVATTLVICSYLSTVLMNYTALSQIFNIKREYLQAALNQDVEWYDLNKTGDFASKMSGDIMKMQDGMGEKITNFTHLFISFLSSITMAMVVGPKLALVSIITLPLVMISAAFIERVATVYGRKEAVAYSRAATTAEEVLSSVRTVFAFNGHQKEIDRFRIDLTDAKKINIKKSFYIGIGAGLVFLFLYASFGISLWYGVNLVIMDDYTPATMVAVFIGVIMASLQIEMIMPLLEVFGVAKGSAAKIFALIDQVPKINPLLDTGAKPKDLDGQITLKNVHFYYPSRPDLKVLKGVNFTIKKGQTVALVGTSGCGKSTIIQLIQRFYDPTDGTVYIDNNDVRTLSVKWLRSKIGVVGQEPVLFNTTIKNNIRYGCEHATDDQIYAAARQANAHRFIRELPLGYDSVVGDRGTQLSGGQKQRIAIARALIRDPPILLLDEATSALDTSSEAKVQKALSQACKGRTTIIVAHRLTTIRTADIILAFKSGQLIESGTHEKLMQEKGVYFEMVMAQGQPNVEDTEKIRELRWQQSIVSTCSTVKGDQHDEGQPSPTKPKAEPSESFLKVIALSKPEWKMATAACLCAFLVGAGQPTTSILFGKILGLLSSDDTDLLQNSTTVDTVVCSLTGLLMCVATVVKIYLFGVSGEKLTERLRSQMLEKFLSLDVTWFDDKNNSTGALCARLSGEASAVQGATGQRVGTVLEAFGSLVVATGFSLYYEWRVGLVAGAFVPCLVFLLYKEAVMTLQENCTNAQSNENSTKIAIDAVSNIRTVTSLGNESMFVKLYTEELQPALQSSKRGTHIRGVVYGLARGAISYAMAVSMFYGGSLILNHDVDYENVVIAAHASIICTMSVSNAFVYAPNFQDGFNAASRILRLFKTAPTILDPTTPVRENFVSSGPVTYSHINFAYPIRPNTLVLKDMNLEIKSGQTVALVGASGCGKSTMIQLLERFYDPNSGTVELAGHNLKKLRQSELRKNLGIVQQEPILFDRTIGENIAYGDNSRTVTEDEIISAAKQANIHNFVTSLPLGYDTRLGSKGTQLSGGQKQRVAIARALLRNPKILLLDEATSALDVESEKVVQEALDSAKVGRTCIIIAHRLTTVKDADMICVFSEGKVAETGTHSELMAKQGLFYKLQQQI